MSDIFKIITKNKLRELDEVSPEKMKDVLKKVDDLFRVMSGIYGSRWNFSYENDESRDLWVVFLLDFSTEEIASAIEYCVDEDLDMPTLPKFKRLCFKIRENRGSVDENNLLKTKVLGIQKDL